MENIFNEQMLRILGATDQDIENGKSGKPIYINGVKYWLSVNLPS